MKRLTLFVAIFFIALAGNINAQTNEYYYNIDIAGVEVTSSNYSNITGDGITGFVSYDPETKTLTLDNATIDGEIWFDTYEVDDITITLLGANSVSTIWDVSGTKTINGEGSLKASSIACSAEQNTIIEDCTIDIDADGFVSGMYSQNNSTLTIKNANISVVAGEYAIGQFASIELIDCKIMEPVNAQIIGWIIPPSDTESTYICNEDDSYAKKVVIKKVTNYGIYIDVIRVTSDNCNNIIGDGITGSVSYNPETKTLTLDNATIDGEIYFGTGTERIEDITITLIGENTITEEIRTVSGTKKINGTGSLKAREIECKYEQNTIIEDCTIDIPNGWAWVLYSGDDGSKLTIKNANISIEAGTVAIGDFADIELIGCEIVEPVNAQIIDNEVEGDAGKYICNEDGTVANKVVIKKLSGLNDIAQTNSINVYPNPATNEIVINNIANNEIVEVFDIIGKVVKRVVYNNKISVADLQAGVYTIKVNNQIQKLVIE